METESIVSEPQPSTRGFPTERSTSMTVLSPQGKTNHQQLQQLHPHQPPRVAQLETLEAKMASIEVSLSSATPRRRKGTSLGGGSLSARSSPRPDSAPGREMRSALQDREAVIQNLRLQLGLGKLPRPTGPAFDDEERPAAEQKVTKLRSEAENKKVAIRNLKSALEKLDITDNIDIRIRQAELEYALGREELQLLSLVEEARALQARLDKSKPESNSLYGMLQTGINLTLHAVKATPGRWNASMKTDFPGFWVDWALDGEGLHRGDRIIEVNGKMVPGRTREELQKLMSTSGKCEMVVLRKKSLPFSQQQLHQSQADNVRLKHRISYLEDQVKELIATKDNNTDSGSSQASIINGNGGAHVTSISITSPPSTPPDNKPQIYQRGSFVTTIIDGKPSKTPPNCESPKTHQGHVTTTTIIKECDKINGELTSGNVLKHNLRNSMSSSKISINSDMSNSTAQYYQKKERDKREREARRLERERYMQQYGSKLQRSANDLDNGLDRRHLHYHRSHARSVEYLNGTSDRRKLTLPNEASSRREMRSVKSLDFESDNNEQYASEPSGPMRMRPAPPKKPLRLSLQRAQSLQTVEGIMIDAHSDKKRGMKRSHRSGKPSDMSSQYIENNVPLQTASLGRQKYI
ncbi:AAEL006269-PA [Aedes aegypti]|uniref:AAEL006269-PA n=1 Tax=Aedes aegypti TaxID=7159 RepID=Q176T0_AEDAE|nr:AAEL006269-PA [Aedes aegypti]